MKWAEPLHVNRVQSASHSYHWYPFCSKTDNVIFEIFLLWTDPYSLPVQFDLVCVLEMFMHYRGSPASATARVTYPQVFQS